MLDHTTALSLTISQTLQTRKQMNKVPCGKGRY